MTEYQKYSTAFYAEYLACIKCLKSFASKTSKSSKEKLSTKMFDKCSTEKFFVFLEGFQYF